MAGDEVVLRVTGDSGGLTKAFKEADRQAAASMAKIEASVKAANAKMASSIDTSSGKIGKLKASLAENASALSIAEREQVRLTARYGEGSVQADKAALAVRRLATSHAFNAAELAKAEVAEAASLAAMNQRQSRWASFGSTMARVGASATSHISAMAAAVGAAGVSMRNTGSRLTRNVSLPMTILGAVGIKTAIDYEKSMNVLQAVSGATGDQMASFGRLAQALGADLTLPGTSAADATQAMVELAKAGLSIEDSMGAAKGVLQLSAAGGLDNATAASVAANALNAFKLEGSQAVRVADLLAGAANGSSAEVAELADSLSQGASVFAQAGIPIEDFVSSAALLANVGIKGSDAGTSLKSMLLKLQNPSKEAAAMLESMGVSIYDAQGRMRPFRDLIGSFASALGGMNQEQRDAALGTIFGSDAVRAANAVLLSGVDAFDRMKAVTTEQGAAAKMAAAQNKGLGGALDGLKSAMETLMLRVLVPALPVLTRMVTAFANFIPKLTKIPKPVLIAAGAFAAVMVAAGPLLALLGALLSPLAGVAAALAGVGVAVWAALNPEKAGALMDRFKEKWDELAPGVVAALGRLASRVGEWIQTNGPVLLRQLGAWASAFVEWVVPMIPPFLMKLGELLNRLGAWILDTAVPWIAERVRNFVPAFTSWIGQTIQDLVPKLPGILMAILTWITTDAIPTLVKAMAKFGLAIAGGFIESISNAIKSGINVIIRQINNLIGGFNKLPFAPNIPKIPEFNIGGEDKQPEFKRGPGTMLADTAMRPTAGTAGGGRVLALAHGSGGILTARKPTLLMVGEGHGAEDFAANPHSKGGLAGLGGGVTQNNTFVGISYEEAAERSNRLLGWQMALSGRR